MTKSDPNRVLRRLPLVVGGLGAVLLLMNRLLTPELTNSQARGDVLGVILSAVLILTGLIWQQVQPRTPETVEFLLPLAPCHNSRFGPFMGLTNRFELL